MWDEEESNAMMHSLSTDGTALCLSRKQRKQRASLVTCSLHISLSSISILSLYLSFISSSSSSSLLPIAGR